MYTCMLAQEKKQCRAAYNNNKQQRTGILGLAACTQLRAFHIEIPTWSACRTEGGHPPTPAPHPACPELCPAPLHAHRPFPQCQYFCLGGIPFSPTQMSNSLRQKSFCSIPPYFYCISSHTEWLEVMEWPYADLWISSKIAVMFWIIQDECQKIFGEFLSSRHHFW